MVVPHSSYYYPEVVAGAREAADALGVKLTLGVSRNAFAEERALVADMVRAEADGLLVTTAEDPRTSPDTEAWLRGLPLPVVLTERRVRLDSGAAESVATDHEYGAHLAVRHPVERGRSRLRTKVRLTNRPLGDTAPGLTGRESVQLPAAVREPAVVGGSKRDRPAGALLSQQARQQASHCVIAFINAAMATVRYVQQPHVFSRQVIWERVEMITTDV
ncbi:hypothetical protein ACFY6U_06490 [Streptomyces sp. NPDC013157]|uniref:hypothetical protein n=1 Tax=Streptomyces sp. NPDC013157 TaxID=3364861 RepID=UPI0036A43C11